MSNGLCRMSHGCSEWLAGRNWPFASVQGSECPFPLAYLEKLLLKGRVSAQLVQIGEWGVDAPLRGWQVGSILPRMLQERRAQEWFIKAPLGAGSWESGVHWFMHMASPGGQQGDSWETWSWAPPLQRWGWGYHHWLPGLVDLSSLGSARDTA